MKNDIVISDWLKDKNRPSTFGELGEMVSELKRFYVEHNAAGEDTVKRYIGNISVFDFVSLFRNGNPSSGISEIQCVPSPARKYIRSEESAVSRRAKEVMTVYDKNLTVDENMSVLGQNGIDISKRTLYRILERNGVKTLRRKRSGGKCVERAETDTACKQPAQEKTETTPVKKPVVATASDIARLYNNELTLEENLDLFRSIGMSVELEGLKWIIEQAGIEYRSTTFDNKQKEPEKKEANPYCMDGISVIKSKNENQHEIWVLDYTDEHLVIQNPPKRRVVWTFVNMTSSPSKYKCTKIGDVLFRVYIDGEKSYYCMFNNPGDLERMAMRNTYWRMFEYGRFPMDKVHIEIMDKRGYEKEF